MSLGETSRLPLLRHMMSWGDNVLIKVFTNNQGIITLFTLNVLGFVLDSTH